MTHPIQLDAWCDCALALGADAAVAVDVGKVVVGEWVRMKCSLGATRWASAAPALRTCRLCRPPATSSPSSAAPCSFT